jgi:GNAT superfamily N-acetyltransferase
MAEVIEAITAEQVEQVRVLFGEYRAELVVEDCFAAFDVEIATLPSEYAPPGGKLLLATVVGQPVGCVGLRPFPKPGACEMKRLFVRTAFRGGKVGKKLVDRALKEASLLGYSCLRLDTHPPTMPSAVAMYRKLGFREVPADPLRPTEGLVYMELPLRQEADPSPAKAGS